MSKTKHALDLTGKGSETYGGRWNLPGLPALYLAENISLALIETMVHCQVISDLYHRTILSIQIPDDSIDNFDQNKLPKNWNSMPWNHSTIQIGSEWLKKGEKLALKIPSAVVPQESIFVINPKNNKHLNVKIVEKNIFLPDNRLKLA